MSKQADHAPAHAAPIEGLLGRLREWWQRSGELAGMPREELERIAGGFGMTGRELEELAAKGPHAADLLYQRMAALGLARADVERLATGLAGDLEKTCSCCNDKAVCRRDLAARPDDPVWKDYCPNSVTLEAIGKTKGRFPL